MKRLTLAQITLLREIRNQSRYVADYYKPAIILVRLGLAEWNGNHLHITQAGIDALNAEDQP